MRPTPSDRELIFEGHEEWLADSFTETFVDEMAEASEDLEWARKHSPLEIGYRKWVLKCLLAEHAKWMRWYPPPENLCWEAVDRAIDRDHGLGWGSEAGDFAARIAEALWPEEKMFACHDCYRTERRCSQTARQRQG